MVWVHLERLIIRKIIFNSWQRSYTRIRTHAVGRKKMYSIRFTDRNKRFCLSLHYNGAKSCLFVNGTEIYKFIAKDSEIVANPLCLWNISREFSINNMKKTGLNGYDYHCTVDYDAVAVDDMLYIRKYLMKKSSIV